MFGLMTKHTGFQYAILCNFEMAQTRHIHSWAVSGSLFLMTKLIAQHPQLSGLIVFILPQLSLSSIFDALNFTEENNVL